MGQKIEIDEAERKKIGNANIRHIIDRTFGNATTSEKAELAMRMRRWHPGRLDGLRALVDKQENDEARRIMLGWL